MPLATVAIDGTLPGFVANTITVTADTTRATVKAFSIYWDDFDAATTTGNVFEGA